MTLTSLQKKLAFAITLFTVIGMLYSFYILLSNTIVTQNYLDQKMAEDRKHMDEQIIDVRKHAAIQANELNLRLIDESLSRYYDKGIETLKGKDLHRYKKLVLAETANEQQRKILLGL